MGQKILLRLRPHFDPDAFLPEEDLVHTMLHEVGNRPSPRLPLRSHRLPHLLRIVPSQLTHNVHTPHDDSFYKYLAVLESEYEDLRRSGYAGEGFHSPGVRLGVGASHNLPHHLARLKALEAAEKRRRIGGSGGGRRLGEGGILGGKTRLTPKELALRVSDVPSLWNPHFDRCGGAPIGLTDKFFLSFIFCSAIGMRWTFLGC
jgi:hypothetical protein